MKLFEIELKALDNSQPFDPGRQRFDASRLAVPEIPSGYDAVICRNELLQQPIPVLERFPGVLRYAPRQMTHYFTDLRGGLDQAFKTMSSKTRSTIQRKVRSYAEFCGGEIRWQMYRTPEEIASYLCLAREVARKTYQEKLFDAGIPETDEFFRSTMDLAARGAVRGSLLFHGDRPVAYLHTPAPDGFLVYDYLGYDPSYARRSPGTVLQWLVLRDLYAEGSFPMYYWGYGHSQTKEIFATGQVLGADVFYLRQTVRNSAAIGLHRAIDNLSTNAGILLDRLHLKQRIKRRLKGQ